MTEKTTGKSRRRHGEDADDGTGALSKEARDAEYDELGVKLTDISDIVAKYSAVDRVFGDEDEDDDGDDDIFEEFEPREEEKTRPSFLPDRPSIALRRSSQEDRLHSRWADNAKQAVSDIHQAHYLDDEDSEDEYGRVSPHPAVMQRHRRNLARTLTVSIGLPIAGGAVFALLLYMQKDIKPTDAWGWLASSTTTASVSENAPTPNFAAHPEARKQKQTQQVAAMSPTREPVSPESGVKKLDARVAAPVTEPGKEMAEAPASSPNPVYMARLTVTDAQGSSLEPIPLSLAVAPGVPEQRLRIRISGLPDGARLSNGTELGHGEWLLRDNDLENLSMSLAPGFSGEITLLAEVIDDATHIQAAPSKMVSVHVKPEEVVAQPVSAPTRSSNFAEPDDEEKAVTAGPTPIVPTASPFNELQVEAPTPGVAAETQVAALAPATQSATDAAPETIIVDDEAAAERIINEAPAEIEQRERNSDLGLIGKGDVLLTNGDIASARLFYERALKDGDPRAATALGRSYDPVVYEQLKVHGVVPDPNRAVEWYRKGAEAGDKDAREHLQALSQWLKR